MASSGIKREQNKFALLLLTPALLVVLVFTTIPALTTLSYAFFHWTGFQRLDFAGLENFKKLFDLPFRPVFLMALRHNVSVFIGILILQTALGLLIGYALIASFAVRDFSAPLLFYRLSSRSLSPVICGNHSLIHLMARSTSSSQSSVLIVQICCG